MQPVIEVTAGQKILLSAMFYNLAIMQDQYAVSLTYGGEAMGNNQGGSALK